MPALTRLDLSLHLFLAVTVLLGALQTILTRTSRVRSGLASTAVATVDAASRAEDLLYDIKAAASPPRSAAGVASLAVLAG